MPKAAVFPYKPIDYSTSIPLHSKAFQKILSFYLFEDPTKSTNRCTPLEKMDWNNPRRLSILKKKLLDAASSELRDHYHPSSKADLSILFDKERDAKPIEEYCIFLKNDSGEIKSLLSAIRNAFAHGGFDIREYTISKKKTRMYFLCNFDGYEKARIVLREETLLSWVDIIRTGYHPRK